MKKNIILVGFMGTGKTSAGKELAKRLKRKFIEIDELIEKDQNDTIDNIFKTKGETYFRQMEKRITKGVSQEQNAVISAGGGIVLDEENIKNLQRNGLIICLEARAAVIFDRVKKETHRPLLKVENPKQRIRELLEKRRPFYQKINFHIDTSNLSLDQVVDKIIEIYAKNG
jgi:shikimate kinase